jgi:hypothetical protein
MYTKIILIFLFITFQSNAQIVISKNTVDGSELLDFGLNLVNGIVLSSVEEIPLLTAASSNETILVKAVDIPSFSVKMRQNNSWVDLNDQIELSC